MLSQTISGVTVSKTPKHQWHVGHIRFLAFCPWNTDPLLAVLQLTMGKRTDDANAVPNRDIIQRLNFLYQASVYLNDPGNNPPGTQTRSVVTTSDLSRSYVKTMKVIGQKTIVKMCVYISYLLQANPVGNRDPSVKRTLCRGCNIILIPGSTASVRVRCELLSLLQSYLTSQLQALPSHGHAVTYTCNICNTSRRIPAPPTLTLKSTPQPSDPPILESSVPTQRRQRKKKKKPPVARLPPLFAREGHIVFSGNERVEAEQMVTAVGWLVRYVMVVHS